MTKSTPAGLPEQAACLYFLSVKKPGPSAFCWWSIANLNYNLRWHCGSIAILIEGARNACHVGGDILSYSEERAKSPGNSNSPQMQ
jgi:hypothetical protein